MAGPILLLLSINLSSYGAVWYSQVAFGPQSSSFSLKFGTPFVNFANIVNTQLSKFAICICSIYIFWNQANLRGSNQVYEQNTQSVVLHTGRLIHQIDSYTGHRYTGILHTGM